MTARTSQKLADALRAAGFEDLAKRAEADEFHDYLSHLAMPEMTLDRELHALASDESLTDQQRIAATMIRSRHHNGEFDADLAESEEWAASEAGQEAFRMLKGGQVMMEHWKFEEGQRVRKTGGYPFPGVVEVRFRLTQTDGSRVERYVVNRTTSTLPGEPMTGLAHIFAPEQLVNDDRYDKAGVLIKPVRQFAEKPEDAP